jgi:hypothetical protein
MPTLLTPKPNIKTNPKPGNETPEVLVPSVSPIS